jgi:hypothetical protein
MILFIIDLKRVCHYLILIIYFCLVFSDEAYLRDLVLELEMKNELLVERNSDLLLALSELDKRFRHYKRKHVDCKKYIVLYR